MALDKYATWGILPAVQARQAGIGTRLGSLRDDTAVQQAIVSGFNALNTQVGQVPTSLETELQEVRGELTAIKNAVETGLGGMKTDIGTKILGVSTQLKTSADELLTALEEQDDEVPIELSSHAWLIVAALAPLWEIAEKKVDQGQKKKVVEAVGAKLKSKSIPEILDKAALTTAWAELYRQLMSAANSDGMLPVDELKAFHLQVFEHVD